MTGSCTDPIAVGLALGWLADRAFGDPRRGHPVAIFGSWAGAVENRLYSDTRAAGVITQAAVLAPIVAVGLIGRTLKARGRCVATAVVTWAALGGTSLGREGMAVFDLLERKDVDSARQRLRHLVGRVTDELDEDEIARAAIESVAENTSDAVVGTLVWGALLGPGGVALHRAANTLDAMHGHRTARYARFGWAAARLDDLLGWVPARVTVAATALAAPGRAGPVVRIALRDGGAHPSPNAGPVEAGFAAALDLRLGGRTTYASGVEKRPVMGDGPAAIADDLPRAVRLADRIGVISVLGAIAWRLMVGRLRPDLRPNSRRRGHRPLRAHRRVVAAAAPR